MRFSVILGEQLARVVAQILGMRGESFEKGSRSGFSSQVVEGLQNHACTALRRDQPHHRGNHRAVTVAPQNGVLNSESVEKGKDLERGFAMKIERHLAADARGASVTGAIGNQNAKLVFKRRDLPVKWINPVSPPAVENNERLAAAELPVMDGDRADAGCVRGMR